MQSQAKLACVLGLVIPAIASASVVQSTFDTSVDGWTTVFDGTAPQHLASGGNPGGHIFATDDPASQTWFFRAPAKFKGNQTAFVGGNLSFDLRLDGTTSLYNDRDIIIYNNTASIWMDFATFPSTAWSHFSADLKTSANWRIGAFASSSPATAANIQSVLSNVTDIYIRGEFRAGVDSGSLDNVVLQQVPEVSIFTGCFVSLLATQLLQRRRMA